MASRSLGTLTLDLVARIGGFTKGMSQAERAARDSAARIDRSFRNLGRAVRTGFAFLTTGIIANSVQRFIELGDQLDKASKKAGISAEAISELAYAAKLADVDLAGLSNALRFMQTNLSEAETGAKDTQLTLAALGVSLKEIQQLQPDRQFELLADRISGLKDPADKARAATDLFGRAGANLLPLFEDGAEGIRKAREEAERLGLSFSGKQLENLAKADDSIKTLKASFEALGVSLAERVAPSLSYFLEGINSLVSGRDIERIKVLREEIRVLDESIKRGGGTFLTPFVSLGEFGGAPDVEAGIYTLEEQVQKVAELRKRLRALTSTGRGGSGSMADVIVPGYKAAADELKQVGSDIEEVFVGSAKIAVDATGELYRQWEQETQTATETILEEWAEFESKINELVKIGVEGGGISREAGAERMREYAEGVLEEIEPLGKKMTHLLKEETEKISEFQLQAFRNTQDIISDFLDNAFQGQFDNILTSFIRMIDKMVAQALAAQLAQKLFGIDGKGGGWLESAFDFGASLFGGGKAGGGHVAAGMLYRVNEQGMEALSIPGRDDYLMMGNRGGQVIAADRVGARGGTVNQTINVRGSVTQKSARQLALDSAQQQRLAGMRLA